MAQREFTLDNFMAQLGQVKKMGAITKLSKMIVGLKQVASSIRIEEKQIGTQIGCMQAIYSSMTPDERKHPHLLRASRRRRIARGAGVGLIEVGQFLRQFKMSRNMVRSLGSMSTMDKLKVVMGFVTDVPRSRDPSSVHSMPASSRWRRLADWLLWGALVIASALVLGGGIVWLAH